MKNTGLCKPIWLRIRKPVLSWKIPVASEKSAGRPRARARVVGVRVIYYVTAAHQIRMILIYRKGIMDTLTNSQKAQLRALNKGWK